MIRQANGEDYITGNYMIFMGSRISSKGACLGSDLEI